MGLLTLGPWTSGPTGRITAMRKQTGFTLIEIGVVFVIIGLLLGGVLKGRELITSARVRNLIALQDGVKAAFFGFEDRYRALPGDYMLAVQNINGVAATTACGNGNGNGDGRIESANNEMILAWEHLSKAGFISGNYACAAAEGPTTAPVNPYGVYLRLIHDGDYGITGTGAPRHNLKTGAQIPVAIIAEMDRKVDDGAPYTGVFQFSAFFQYSYYQGNAARAPAEGVAAAPACTSGDTIAATWNAGNGSANCGGATLF